MSNCLKLFNVLLLRVWFLLPRFPDQLKVTHETCFRQAKRQIRAFVDVGAGLRVSFRLAGHFQPRQFSRDRRVQVGRSRLDQLQSSFQ